MRLLQRRLSVVAALAVTVTALGLIAWRVTIGSTSDGISLQGVRSEGAETLQGGSRPSATVSATAPPSGRQSEAAEATATPGVATPAPSACGASDVDAVLTTDKTAYQAGDTVWVSMKVTYRGTGRCLYGGGCIPFVIVRDSGGHEIPTTMTPPTCAKYGTIVLHPSAVLVERYPWDQQPLNADGTATTGVEVPRGIYTLTGDWHALGLTNTATIRLGS